MRWCSVSPRILQTLAWIPVRSLLNIFCNFTVQGSSNLIGLQQAIFAVNHSSELDPIILTAALSPLGRFAPMFYLAGPREMFDHERFGFRRYIYTGLFFKAWGAYPAPRGLKNYEKTLIVHTTMLLQGASLCVFPEGAVTKTGALGEPRGGLIHLALSSGVAIVPVAISQVYKMSAGDFFRRKRRVVLEFGKPVGAEAIRVDATVIETARYREAAAPVFKEIYSMLESHSSIIYRVPASVRYMYTILRTVLGPVVRLIWVRRVTGLQNLPRTGAALIAANHQSYFDFICTIAIARRNVYYLAAEKFFRNPHWRPLMLATGQIEIDRANKQNRTHIDKIVHDLLGAGHAVGIFPEGTRAPTPTTLIKGYPGIIRYAVETGVPIVPIGIKGTYEVMSRFDTRPRVKKIVELHVGSPICHDDPLTSEPSEETISRELANLMRTLATLSGKTYTGA